MPNTNGNCAKKFNIKHSWIEYCGHHTQYTKVTLIWSHLNISAVTIHHGGWTQSLSRTLKGSEWNKNMICTRCHYLCKVVVHSALNTLVDIPQMPQQVHVQEESPLMLQATSPTRHSKIMTPSCCSCQRTCKHQEY